MSNRTAIALGAAAGVLLLLALWFLVVSPKRSEAARLESDLATAQAELTTKKSELANPSAAVTVRTSDVFRLAKALPEDTNVAAAMLDVDRLAARHGLTLEGFQPTEQIPVVGYYAQPVTVTVQGRFGKVSRFLRDLRKLVIVKKGRLVVDGRLYSVTEVRLSRPEGEELGFPVVRAGILLNAFGFTPGVPTFPSDTTGEETTTPSSDGTSAAGATP